MKEITAIERGFGESSLFYKVGNQSVTQIKKVLKPIEFNADGNITNEIEAYQVLTDVGMICEIESNSSITLYF